MPASGGNSASSWDSASSPPAEAPIDAMMGNGRAGLAGRDFFPRRRALDLEWLGLAARPRSRSGGGLPAFAGFFFCAISSRRENQVRFELAARFTFESLSPACRAGKRGVKLRAPAIAAVGGPRGDAGAIFRPSRAFAGFWTGFQSNDRVAD